MRIVSASRDVPLYEVMQKAKPAPGSALELPLHPRKSLSSGSSSPRWHSCAVASRCADAVWPRLGPQLTPDEGAAVGRPGRDCGLQLWDITSREISTCPNAVGRSPVLVFDCR